MNAKSIPLAKFRCGKIVTTPNALSQLNHEEILLALKRHQAGDWGDVDEHDRQANERALIERTRLWSVYHAGNGTKFWIITEADRQSTPILLPEDY